MVGYHLIGNENQVKTTYKNKDTADSLKNYCPPGFLVPIHVPLHQFCTGTGQNDDRTMSQTILDMNPL